eukprot:2716964-Lingulodinium_polyedra.AAC.1
MLELHGWQSNPTVAKPRPGHLLWLGTGHLPDLCPLSPLVRNNLHGIASLGLWELLDLRRLH